MDEKQIDNQTITILFELLILNRSFKPVNFLKPLKHRPLLS